MRILDCGLRPVGAIGAYAPAGMRKSEKKELSDEDRGQTIKERR